MAKKLTDLTATTGRAADERVQDALTGYLEELASLRATLDTRRVYPIDGEEAFTRLREKSTHRRPGA